MSETINSLAQAGEFFAIIMIELTILFIGITFLVGIIQEYVSEEKIRRALGSDRRKVFGCVIGAVFGSLTPFCSCSTIPIFIGLVDAGVPFAIAMSFLIASPLLNPVIIGLLLLLLGSSITVIYVVVAFVSAIIIGLVLDAMGFACYLKSVEVVGKEEKEEIPISATDDFWRRHAPRLKRAGTFAWSLFFHMFPYLLIGAGIGAFIYGFVPQDIIVQYAGPGNPFAIPVAAAIGIPMYIRAETIIPIGFVLVEKGMSVGTAIALIIGGAGASIPELTMLAAIFKRKLLAAFIVVILGIAIFTGYLSDFLVPILR
ncbi:MAG: permease [Methanomassiliicoccales archaeon]|nr:permease [Methanomassiliicoccales archaeon]